MASTRLDPYALEDPTAAPALDAAEPSPSRIRVARGALERVLGSPLAVVTVAVAAAVSATIWSATTHSMLLYGDAQAHLDVARRVTDGLQVGPTQLGSVWLPMPHILMVPLTAVRVLWRSGAAGAIVGGACYLYAATCMYRLVNELTDSRVAAWIAFGVFAANLNLLYIQSTALTEPVLLAFLVGATLHFSRWMRTLSARELLWAAILTVLATLTRYEGWAFLCAGLALVFVWGRRVDRRRHSTQANVVLYGVVGVYGVILWFLYNLTIFHDALYFARSPYSAVVMQNGEAHFGLLATKGNLVESALTYGWAMLGIVGPAVLIAAGVGAVLLFVLPHPRRAETVAVLGLLLAPVLFEILSLYVGQTTIRVTQRPPHQMYNIRYGLMVLPFCAFAIAVVLTRRRWLGALVAAGAIAGLVAALFATPITIADGRRGISSATAGHPLPAADYLRAHYEGGRVLADDSASSTVVWGADLDLREFVTPGFHPYWEDAIRAPAHHVRWALSVTGDAVSRDFVEHPERFADFRVVVRDNRFTLYERIDR
ncbi:MAG: hypothetical protein C5B48_15425 [Candidatus Rokuibacteriota bacterium]|nr:MAG: hypothetical protein C5B48_15425 [Candidatus Rokubacteria bacterium]